MVITEAEDILNGPESLRGPVKVCVYEASDDMTDGPGGTDPGGNVPFS
jgi:hypothetical protein